MQTPSRFLQNRVRQRNLQLATAAYPKRPAKMNSSSLSAAPRVDREKNRGLGLGRLFKRLCRSTWCLRNRIPFLDVGIPCRLVDGSRVWAYGDVMGWTMLNGSLR